MARYQERAFCPKCGFNDEAPFGETFFLNWPVFCLPEMWQPLRTQHANQQGELHILMTRGEYKLHEKRLAALYALNFDVHVMGA